MEAVVTSVYYSGVSSAVSLPAGRVRGSRHKSVLTPDT